MVSFSVLNAIPLTEIRLKPAFEATKPNICLSDLIEMPQITPRAAEKFRQYCRIEFKGARMTLSAKDIELHSWAAGVIPDKISGGPVVISKATSLQLPKAESAAPQRRVRCYGYHSEGRYYITRAPGVQFTRLPEAFDSRHATLDYRGSYQRTAQGVQVLRSLHDHTPQGLCEPGYMRDWMAQAEPVARSLQGQVFYRLQKPTAAATSKNSGPKKKAVRKPKKR